MAHACMITRLGCDVFSCVHGKYNELSECKVCIIQILYIANIESLSTPVNGSKL